MFNVIKKEQDLVKSNISKMYGDSSERLEKSEGEGSRGGVIIGHTKSGKPVYDSKLYSSKSRVGGYLHPDWVENHKDFTSQDHVDVVEHYNNLKKKLKEDEKKNEYGDGTKYKEYRKNLEDINEKVRIHSDHATSKDVEDMKAGKESLPIGTKVGKSVKYGVWDSEKHTGGWGDGFKNAEEFHQHRDHMNKLDVYRKKYPRGEKHFEEFLKEESTSEHTK